MIERAVGETELFSHIASCPWCHPRVERALDVWQRRRQFPTEAEEAPLDTVRYAAMVSPLGVLWLAQSDHGLVGVSCTSDEAEFCQELENHGTPWYDPAALQPLIDQIDSYFAGERQVFDLPIDVRRCTPFQRQVLEAVATIPYGVVQSYGEIADRIGRPRAMRAVGTAVAGNPVSLVVPCHRVIRSDGTPGEYARATLGTCGTGYKVDLLALEGAIPPGRFGTMTSGPAKRARNGSNLDRWPV